MEFFHISSLLLLLGTSSCYVGSAKAKVTINVPASIPPGKPISGNCIASGKMYSRIPSYFYIRVKLEGNDNKGDCDIKHIGRFQKLSHAKYRQKFNITCDNGNNSVEIKCFTYRNDEKETYQIYVEAIEPKIISKPCNITTEVGQLVTLTCYVEGDPKHYWVGWMSRNTIIHAGDEHSISTSPSFRSLNGTVQHLTIHSVKVSSKYECILYTVEGDVQDKVTHNIAVHEENHEDSTSPSPTSLLNIISSLFF